jgi:hypothetical protein
LRELLRHALRLRAASRFQDLGRPDHPDQRRIKPASAPRCVLVICGGKPSRTDERCRSRCRKLENPGRIRQQDWWQNASTDGARLPATNEADHPPKKGIIFKSMGSVVQTLR